MVKLNIAWTSPINPPSASPILTVEQVWAGLERKVRHAQEFVPAAIESCEVLSDENGIVDRIVTFKAGVLEQKKARETVTGFKPAWVDFRQESGLYIRNIISESDAGLNMTYTFEFEVPNAEEGSEAAEKELTRMKGMARIAVEDSIKTIREMVKDGRIP